MQRAFVLDKNRNPLMPCRASRARKLLSKGKAVLLKLYPFTILIKDREGGAVQDIELKIDPGSKTSGIALVGYFKKRMTLIWAANLTHRGTSIKSSLDSRRAIRKSRRQRKTRYRSSRFDNRRRKEVWIAPSLQSRVDNILTFVKRLQTLAPISSTALETVLFDMQEIQNSEISGKLYQQGELMGYEIREYLLEKWGRKCAYCSAKNTRLEIDHIVPKSKGGSDRVSNLTIACRACNLKKANHTLEDFLHKNKNLYSAILSKTKAPLIHAAAVNTTRNALALALDSSHLPLTKWSGGRTKYNRVKQCYEKDHYIDAACVGKSGENIYLPEEFHVLLITATGRGSRQFCRVDKHGFPRTSAKKQRSIHGFKTGNLVKAFVEQGKKKGEYFGRVAVRLTGYFCIDTADGKVDGINHRYCQNKQQADGYNYISKKFKTRSSVSSSS
ncbi:MAG: HNH endonuclease [Simkaniaceae bacterium]|nr:HNH endonuclease [Simkaniaceae bacterium]